MSDPKQHQSPLSPRSRLRCRLQNPIHSYLTTLDLSVSLPIPRLLHLSQQHQLLRMISSASRNQIHPLGHFLPQILHLKSLPHLQLTQISVRSLTFRRQHLFLSVSQKRQHLRNHRVLLPSLIWTPGDQATHGRRQNQQVRHPHRSLLNRLKHHLSLCRTTSRAGTTHLPLLINLPLSAMVLKAPRNQHQRLHQMRILGVGAALHQLRLLEPIHRHNRTSPLELEVEVEVDLAVATIYSRMFGNEALVIRSL